MELTRGRMTTAEVLKHPIVKFVLPIYTVLAPLEPVMIAAWTLLITDLILGIWAAKKRGIGFSSARFASVLPKTFLYTILLVVSFVAETYLVKMVPAINIISSFIAIRELTSVYENAGIILGQPLPTWILKKLESKNKEKGK